MLVLLLVQVSHTNSMVALNAARTQLSSWYTSLIRRPIWSVSVDGVKRLMFSIYGVGAVALTPFFWAVIVLSNTIVRR